MEHSALYEADHGTAGQEIPRLICNPKFHYRFQNNPSLDSNNNVFGE